MPVECLCCGFVAENVYDFDFDYPYDEIVGDEILVLICPKCGNFDQELIEIKDEE